MSLTFDFKLLYYFLTYVLFIFIEITFFLSFTLSFKNAWNFQLTPNKIALFDILSECPPISSFDCIFNQAIVVTPPYEYFIS